MQGVELIRDGDDVLAYIIGRVATSEHTGFITSDDDPFQAGFIVYERGGKVQAHLHLPIQRTIVGTAEVLMVRSGRCFVDIYSDDRRLVATRELTAGDAVLSVAGGHGFRMIEDTVLFEVKQGPYSGQGEKERFETDGDGEAL